MIEMLNCDCKEYYKLKGVKNTEQQVQPNLQTNKGIKQNDRNAELRLHGIHDDTT